MLLSKINNSIGTINEIKLWATINNLPMVFNTAQMFNPDYRFVLTGFNFWTRKIKFTVEYLPRKIKAEFEV